MSNYNSRQMLKSIALSVLTFVAVYYLQFFVVNEDSIAGTEMWHGVIQSLASSHFLAIHFWIVYVVMLYLTAGDIENSEYIIRYGGKKQWLTDELSRLVINSVLFSAAYIAIVVFTNLLFLGWPDVFRVDVQYIGDIAVNYSLGFILVLSFATRCFCAFSLVFVYLLLYSQTNHKIMSLGIIGIYCTLCSIIIYFGLIFQLNAAKILVYPSATSYIFFTFGNIVHNFVVAFVLPFVIAAIIGCFLMQRIKRMEFI